MLTWLPGRVTNQDGNGQGIYAQAYNNTNNPQGGEFRVNTYTQKDQEFSSVAMDNSGKAVVVWTSDKEDGNNFGVYAQQFLTSNILVTPTAGLSTTSTGGTATFQVVLTQAPLGIVTIPWSSSNTNEGTISVASTTFTILNWNIPQTITVTGVNDGVSTGNVGYQIIGGPATGLLDPSYQGELAPTVFVTNSYGVVAAGISVSPTGITTSESGATGTFSVVLDSAPTAPVTINLGIGNPAAGSLSQTSLTFDATNWNVAQTVTVTGLNDNITTPNQIYQITGNATSTDPNYNNMTMTPVTVTNNETGVAVTGNSFLIAEDNKVVRLNSSTGAVIATYPTGVANDGAIFGPDGSLYVADYFNHQILHYDTGGTLLASFGSGQLNSPQGLAFGPDGNLYVTDTSDTVQKFSPTGAFLGTFISAGSGGLTNAKAIVWGPDGNAYVSSYFNSEVIRYNGTTGAFMNVFATGSGGFEDLTFGPNNNLYVASYSDNAVYAYDGTSGASLGTFVTGIATPFGLRFDPAGNLDVSSRTTGKIETFNGTTGAFMSDLAIGLANPAYLTTTTSLITSEAGASSTFSVSLMSQPTANVTFNLSNSDPTQGSLSQSTLTFTPGNWNVAQTVTVTGLNAFITTPYQAYQITGNATSTDPDYNNMTMAPVTVTNYETANASSSVLVSSGSPSLYGQTVTLTATVSAVAPMTGTPTGTVSFFDGTNLLAVAALNGGTAALTISTLAPGTHNITITYSGDAYFTASTSAALAETINPIILTVSANNANRIYGQANPAFTDTVTGFINGDTSSVLSGAASLTTAAGASSGVGTYTITAAQGTLSAPNYYAFSFANGSLKIRPAALIVTADSTSKHAGQANPAFTATVTGFVNGDNASVLGGQANLTTAATVSSPIGSYAINAGRGSLTAANYTLSFASGTLTVTSPNVTSLPSVTVAATVSSAQVSTAQAKSTVPSSANGPINVPAAPVAGRAGDNTLTANSSSVVSQTYTSGLENLRSSIQWVVAPASPSRIDQRADHQENYVAAPAFAYETVALANVVGTRKPWDRDFGIKRGFLQDGPR